MSLYTITKEYQRLMDAIECGEIPEEAIADTLEAVSGEWEERAEAVLAAIKNLRAEANNIKAEEEALAERRKAKEATAKRLTEYLSAALRATGKTKYESARHSVSFRSSTSIRITDEEAFIKYALDEHHECVKIKTDYSPDKTVIKELLKTVELPYVELEVKQNIQIK